MDACAPSSCDFSNRQSNDFTSAVDEVKTQDEMYFSSILMLQPKTRDGMNFNLFFEKLIYVYSVCWAYPLLLEPCQSPSHIYLFVHLFIHSFLILHFILTH